MRAKRRRLGNSCKTLRREKGKCDDGQIGPLWREIIVVLTKCGGEN